MSTSLMTSKQANSFSRDNLHEYQKRAIEFIKTRSSCALWVDMGLGKTVTTLTAVSDLIDQIEALRVLIIAPKRVAITTWPAEIRRWEHTKHLSFAVIDGTPKARKNKLTEPTDLHIISRDLVPWLVQELGTAWPYDTVVIDEASSFKSPQAKRFKCLKKVRPYIRRTIELTGTPASNSLLDIWSQIFLIDGGERLGKTYSKYRGSYFNGDYMGYSWEPKPGAENKIYAKLSDICLTLAAKDYLDLPGRVDNIVPVTLPEKARAQYETLERDFLIELESSETVEALFAASLTNKLLQFANGALYIDDEGAWEAVHDAKLSALEDLIESAAGRPTLVAYNFKSDLARILARFPNAEIIGDDPKVIDRWNKGEIPLLLAHPASAGHGLNLQAGGNTIVWFGLNWSLELYQQFNARLDRQGQTKPVIIHHLVVENSVDQTVMQALGRKDTTQRALLMALKEDMKSRMETAND